MIQLAKTGLLILMLTITAGAFSYIQAAYQAPIQDPPGGVGTVPLGGVDAPINLDDDFQDMTGGLEADSLGVTYGMSIGGVSRTACPNPPGDCYPPPTGVATCHLEVRRVDWTTGTYTFVEDTLDEQTLPIFAGYTCDDYLTDEAKAAGWAASGEDNCLGTSGTNCSTMRPSTCMYTRLVCSSDLQVSPSRVTGEQYFPPGLWPLLPAGYMSLPINSTSTNPL